MTIPGVKGFPMTTLIKQKFVLGANTLLVTHAIFGVEKKNPSLWAHSPVWIRYEEPGRYLEETQPFEIRESGNPEVFGKLEMEGDKFGVIISYSACSIEHWPIVDEFVNIMIEILEQEGFRTVPYDGKPFDISPNELEFGFQTSKTLSTKNNAIPNKSEKNGKNDCQGIIPVKPESLRKWREVFQAIQEMEETYLQNFENGDSKNSTPKNNEIRDHLNGRGIWAPNVKTLNKIKLAGKKGCLSEN